MDLPGLRETGHVEFAAMHVLATLQDNRAQPEGQQLERREETGGACAHHDDLGRIRHIPVRSGLVFIGRLTGEPALDLVTHFHVSAGVNRAPDNAADRIRTDQGRLVGFRRINDIDNGTATQVQGLGGRFPDIVLARLTADRTSNFK